MKAVAKHIYAVVLIIVFMQAGFGQSAKPRIPIAQYGKWSTITDPQIASIGDWISFRVQYDNGIDTLIVCNPLTDKKYLFPECTKPEFSDNGEWIVLLDKDQRLIAQNLKSGKRQSFDVTSRFTWLQKSNFLVTLSNSNATPVLKILDVEKGTITDFSNVTDYAISKQGNIIVLSQNAVRLIEPENNYRETIIIDNIPGNYKKSVWSNSGNRIAFLSQQQDKGLLRQDNVIFCYDIKKQMLKKITSGIEELKGQIIVAPLGIPALSFSADDETLFFYRATPLLAALLKDALEVWDTETPLEYPMQKYQGNPKFVSKLTAWSLTDDRIDNIGTDELPQARILPGTTKAIVYNKLAYEPQIQYAAPADFYLLDFKTGEKKLLLKKYSSAIAGMGASPTGRYISYFKDKAWWVFDIETDVHRNLTKDLKVCFSDNGREEPGEAPSFNLQSWSADETLMIVRDAFDIWLLSLNGSQPYRITKGRETSVSFSIAEDLPQAAELNVDTVDFTKGLLLKARSSDMDTGYYSWDQGKGLKQIVYGNADITYLRIANKSGSCIWLQQESDKPTSILYQRKSGAKIKTIFQSNPGFKNWALSRSELLTYRPDGFQELNAALLYPAGYQKGKKYPMIVYIYEKLSHRLHNFERPMLAKGDGFPIANYTQDGYFVLLPDINYKIGEVGKSALTCVLASVSAVKQMGIIDESRIGLIGHSFGGYEVAYIISQTDTFATAVQGAGITDFVSYYLSMHWETEHSNMWRFETQQQRMGKMLYDDYFGYVNNSPIRWVSSINTPLFSWSGKEDKNVPYTQSMALHLALRRLGKKNEFIVYPGEPHILINYKNQLDLVARMKAWFDTYLKR